MVTTNDNSPSPAQATSDGMARFGPHVVAVIDFLGQSDGLPQWDFLPRNAEETAAWFLAVRTTMGRVLTWREQFDKGIASFLDSLRRSQEESAPSQPSEVRRKFDEFRQTDIHHQHFSDALIFYSPLMNSHGYPQMSNVAGMVCMCGSLMLAALGRETVFRGGVEIGMLTRSPTGDPYGPALASAHRLESRIAQYPRIVLGATLLSYVDARVKDLGSDPATQANRDLALDCRKHICRDSDDCWIVDYLNNAFVSEGNPALWRKLQAEAFAFIQSELGRFKAAGDKKLVARYERLSAYFESRGSTRG